MQINMHNLSGQLQQTLPPCILLFGDEPLQSAQAVDAIRTAARAQGFAERHTYTADKEFSWDTLIEASQTMSLFSDKQLIECHLPTGKPGKVGGQVLVELMANPSPDVVLVIIGPRASRDIQNTKWFKTLNQAGWFVPFYAVSGGQLTQWVAQQLRDAGLAFASDVPAFLANSCEGNMLAGYQEIQKLKLLYPTTALTLELCRDAVTEQSRYNMFQLTDKVIQGNAQGAIKLLYRLESEGVEPNAIIWQLIKEWQILYRIKHSSGAINWRALGVWGQGEKAYLQAAHRLSQSQLLDAQTQLEKADFAFKNQTVVKPYVKLAQLCLLLTGTAVPKLDLVV